MRTEYVNECNRNLDTQLMFLYSSSVHLAVHLSISQEFAGEDTSDLFLEERESSLRQAQEEKHKLQMSVPGILNPHELPEEMCDWVSCRGYAKN